ncbi:MAG: hypothetical protein FRX49_12815 [Trebouxia sp. A1-2]|nr:MAG: hypothetical protein FRX49_12815 [Trebouxia sp. A1-2]
MAAKAGSCHESQAGIILRRERQLCRQKLQLLPQFAPEQLQMSRQQGQRQSLREAMSTRKVSADLPDPELASSDKAGMPPWPAVVA